VLLAETREGYANLIKLVSAGTRRASTTEAADRQGDAGAHAKGLIGLSSCLKGEIPSHLRRRTGSAGDRSGHRSATSSGPGNFFLELQWHGIEDQKVVNRGLVPIARELDLPLVCTNDVHYLHRRTSRPARHPALHRHGQDVNEASRMRYHGDQFYLKTPRRWRRCSATTPRRCEHAAHRRAVQRGPERHREPPARTSSCRTASRWTSYFEHEVRRGSSGCRACRRWRDSGAAAPHPRGVRAAALVRDRDDQADEVPGYFLIVWDFIRYAREQGIPVGPGRGSAAGSLVAYCLRITDVDPLEFDLIFERFLNPERVSLPDIDIDFCERRRGEVIEYVTRKYGRENVAQIITFGTMKAKAVVRDVARALDIPLAEANKVAKLIPAALDITIAKALEETPALRELEQSDPRVKELLHNARRLEGMTRHASVHAAGVVIAPAPITEFAPLYKGARDEIVTQWAMKEIERIGLLKMDFLGLSTLTLIHDALEEIARTTGERLDIDKVPLDDAKTYQLFGEGQTYGVFQFESSGMRDILRRAKPQRSTT
jgi:DNA polymerase III subunit alpha